MRLKSSLIVAGVAVVALIAAGGYRYLHQGSTPTVSADFATLATPPGVTIQWVGEKLNSNIQFGVPTRKLAYANAKGMTFYTYDKDVEPGKSACAADCAKAWAPATASADAVGLGKWSVIAREDGAKQWAYKGKPLYTSDKDKSVSEEKGDGADQAVWHTAVFNPMDGLEPPVGTIALREVPDANGQVLVDDHNMTLYAFGGDVNRDGTGCTATACDSHWKPLAAALLANPIGDFSFIARKDGIRQWAYKGRPLYTYDGDLEPGDATGVGVDNRFQVAAVLRYFMPAEVSIRPVAHKGDILATASGMTLYRRDGYTYQVGGHSLHRGISLRPSAGRVIATDPISCNADCLKMWHPLVAPANAQSSGYWQVVDRGDGTKQWAYQSFPMYTYAGDKQPGDMLGNDIYDMVFSSDSKTPAQLAALQFNGAGALYWTYTPP